MADELSRDKLESLARRYARQFTERVSKRVWEGGGENPAYSQAVKDAPSILNQVPKSQREQFNQMVEILKKKQGLGSGGGGSKSLMIPRRGDE